MVVAPNGNHKLARAALKAAGQPEYVVRCRHTPQGLYGSLHNYSTEGAHHVFFEVRRPRLTLEDSTGGEVVELGNLLAKCIAKQMYLFGAERFQIGEREFGHRDVLESDARNLPEVLNHLQSNPAQLRRFNALVRRVLPQIHWISVEPREQNRLRILVWNTDPESGRLDLTVPLSQSGTGVGQVLAILYVTASSHEPRVIAIDEPQSFLHPGAVRALLEILREYSLHQFLITTHSPIALTAALPQTILHVQINEGVSSVSDLSIDEAEELRVLLVDLGVRIEDVFGFDSIMWVEGRTEELCFPLILKQLANRPIARIGILGLVATGDLEGRHRELAFEVYQRLAEGSGVLPPAVAFVFDRERRTDGRIAGMTARGEGKVAFLPCRMFENYLLDADAIAAVAGAMAGFEGVTPANVRTWLERRRWDRELFEPGAPPAGRSDQSWFDNVSGASVLEKAFAELSEARVSYDKVKHGQALTKWLLEHKRDTLQPLADFLTARLPG